jgi:hypothetical protein
MDDYKLRYEGDRWAVVYGSYQGVEEFAVNELQRATQRFLPYVVEIHAAGKLDRLRQNHLFLIGTPANNPLLAEIIRRGMIAPPPGPEGYSCACLAAPWSEGKKLVVIAGHDANGVLYGVEDFNSRILSAKLEPDNPTPERLRKALDEIQSFSLREHPLIENRGIWTWGYVIYDYRRFLDNMARLKLNMLTIWNDHPPLNFRQVLDYAHSRGIRVILGFPWGWGRGGLDLSNKDHREQLKREVCENFQNNYRDLGMDGIYFQTLTEHAKTRLNGTTVASLTCALVNDIAGALFAISPNLHIQFGLHATSIMDNYPDLTPLDSRLTIVWEDAGAIPYSYKPELGVSREKLSNPSLFDTAEHTLAYSKKLAVFRPGTEFALVPKGWINLRWPEDFEHHGPFILGERDRSFIRRRLAERQAYWDNANTRWLRSNALAAKFYREILDCRPPKMTVTALVEDGLFEEVIQPSAALFAETVWNPRQTRRTSWNFPQAPTTA